MTDPGQDSRNRRTTPRPTPPPTASGAVAHPGTPSFPRAPSPTFNSQQFRVSQPGIPGTPNPPRRPVSREARTAARQETRAAEQRAHVEATQPHRLPAGSGYTQDELPTPTVRSTPAHVPSITPPPGRTDIGQGAYSMRAPISQGPSTPGAVRTMNQHQFGSQNVGATGGSGRSTPSTGGFSPPAQAHQNRQQAAQTRAHVQNLINNRQQAPQNQQGPGVHALQGTLFNHTSGPASNPQFTLNPQAVAAQPTPTTPTSGMAGVRAAASQAGREIRAAAPAAAKTGVRVLKGAELAGKALRDVGQRSMATPKPIAYNSTWRAR